MRVIAGSFKGRRLSTVNDYSVRPVTDRVKQVIFDILATRVDLTGAHVLDLFAGSGSLGIEALSRGASQVEFVENLDAAADCIEKNLKVLGCGGSASIRRIDARRYLKQCTNTFVLVFADPPYSYTGTTELPATLFSRKIIAKGGYAIIEHPSTIKFQDTPLYVTGPQKRFGRTIVTFFCHPPPMRM